MNENKTPQTKTEDRLLKVIRRIHAGHNLAGFLIPYQEVCEKTQKIVLSELDNWDR